MATSSTPAASASSMMIASAVFVAPSLSTSDWRGSVRWFFPAAVMTAFFRFMFDGVNLSEQPADTSRQLRPEAPAQTGRIPRCSSSESVHAYSLASMSTTVGC